MRTATPTLLSLDQWARIIGLDPWYIAQVGDGTLIRARGQKDNVVYQYSWQQLEQLSREEIAQSIADAENMFATVCGYWPAPRYVENEQVWARNYHTPDLYSTRVDFKGFPKTITTKYQYIRSLGTATLTEIGDSVVVQSDADGDGLNDTFTTTATVPAGTNPWEVKAYFITANRAGLLFQECEIKPLRVSVSGTTATISGPLYLLVLPALQLARDAEQLNAGNAIYATSINVRTEIPNLNESGQLQWEVPDCTTEPCTVQLSTACFGARNAKLGILTYVPAEYSSTDEAFTRLYPYQGWRDPDRIFVNYYSGYQLDQWTYQMDNIHARIIAYLATALLPNKKCGVARADQRLTYYRTPPTDEEGRTILTSAEQAANPFGIERGALMAWQLCSQTGIVRLGVVGTGGT